MHKWKWKWKCSKFTVCPFAVVLCENAAAAQPPSPAPYYLADFHCASGPPEAPLWVLPPLTPPPWVEFKGHFCPKGLFQSPTPLPGCWQCSPAHRQGFSSNNWSSGSVPSCLPAIGGGTRWLLSRLLVTVGQPSQSLAG